jgi:hypothetical protein
MDCQHFPVLLTREARGSVPTAIIRCERCGIETRPRIRTGGDMDTTMLWEDWAALMAQESAGRKVRSEQDQGQSMTSFYRSTMDAFDKAAKESLEKRAAEMKGVPVPTVPAPDFDKITRLSTEKKALAWESFVRGAFPESAQRWHVLESENAARGMGLEYREMKKLESVVREYLGPKANKDVLGLVLAAAKRFRNVIDNVAKGKAPE